MTSAEALRELRLLLAHELGRPPRDVDWPVVRSMLWDVHYVLEGGCNPLIELRIRRYKRRAAGYHSRDCRDGAALRAAGTARDRAGRAGAVDSAGRLGPLSLD